MPIRPIDVRRKEFKNGFRGYDANQVDDFLDAVADEFERSYTENQRMREEVSSLRDRLQQFEDLEGSIRAALVHAEQAANDLRRAASKEAEDVRQGAAREAEFTVREAQSRSHQMLADTSARIGRVQESYEVLQEAKRSFGNDFRHLLKTYQDMMENMEVSSAQEIEASLRARLDTESMAVVHEAAREEDRLAEEQSAAAFAVAPETEPSLSGEETFEPEEELDEEPAPDDEAVMEDPDATQRIEPEADGPLQEEPEASAEDSPTEVIRPEDSQTEGPLVEEPGPGVAESEGAEPDVGASEAAEPEAAEPEAVESEAVESEAVDSETAEPEAVEPEVSEPEVEPSTAQGEVAQEEPPAPEPEAAGEVESEESSLAEEESSQEFFDQGESTQARGDNRIFRASRFLRRRE
ncbi:MAG: DivIVA domain-containing protein [Rubrobacter sp.]